MTQQSYQFQTEVSRLLEIVTHSLYSEKEIFLRELISNAADACDRLRYATLSDEALKDFSTNFKISVQAKTKENTLLISDNGIGMGEEDLKENLGTIARSGTSNFIKKLQDNKENAANLIGQFGVGFYAAFMVAEKVEVLTKKAGETQAYKWTSEGLGEYTIEEAEKETAGTDVTLYLKKDETEFLEKVRLQHIIKTYSDFITVPIFLGVDETASEQANTAKPLWTLPKKDISKKDYEDFYQTACGAFDTPWETLHFQAEGLLNYTGLLFIPDQRPFDLFDPKREVSLKLYIRHVFITEACQELLPKYLRFVKGIVDAEDLSVNVSREMLQNDPRLRKMKQALTKKILGTLETQIKKQPEDYLKFWKNFGSTFKEGLYEDSTEKDKLLPLCLFYSQKSGKEITLDAYINAFKEGQKDIYYLSGSDLSVLKNNPNLEGFEKNGIDVLLMSDPVDEFWTTMAPSYKEHKFVSITSSNIDLSAFGKKKDSQTEEESSSNLEPLLKFVKTTLGSDIKDVKISHRLNSSPVCLVQDEEGMSARLQQMLQQGQKINLTQNQTLEINPDHPLIQAMLKEVALKEKQSALTDKCWLLLDQAMIVEGMPVRNGQDFAARLNRVIEGI